MRSMVVLALALAACDINGNAWTYAGASVYQDPDGGFHLYYISPPWRVAAEGPDHLLHLVVDDYSQFGAQYQPENVSYKLWVRRAANADLRGEAERLRDLAEDKGQEVVGDLAEVQARSGVLGWEVHTTWDPPTGRLYYRETLFTDGNDQPIQISVAAAYPTDSDDVDLLVLSFTHGPAPALPTPPRRPDSKAADGGPPGDAADGGLP